MHQKIRFVLRSFDHNLLDRSAQRIVKTSFAAGTVVVGPIPLPTKIERFTVLRSPHVDKKSREQFEQRTYKRLIEIYSNDPYAMHALTKLEIPAGVEIRGSLQNSARPPKST